MPRKTLRVTERRTRTISSADHRLLEKSEGFAELASKGVATLASKGAHWKGIRASSFVGAAQINDEVELLVEEKICGALQGLLRWAVPEDLRALFVPSFQGTDEVLKHLASRFHQELEDYLSRGRVKVYVRSNEIGSKPRGRVDTKGTVKQWSRGKNALVSYDRPSLTARVRVNELFRLALSEIEALFTAKEDQPLLARNRAMLEFFGDVPSWRLERMPTSSLAKEFDTALREPRIRPDMRRTLLLARAIGLHLGPWSNNAFADTPISFFLNLEALFEDAVRSVLQKLFGDRRAVKGRLLGRSLFSCRPGFTADPDIVVTHDARSPLVLDCKYKDIDGSTPGHSDVYQILAHCDAFGSDQALLVYPGDRSELHSLGRSRGSGVTVRWCTLNPSTLEASTKAMLQQAGYSPPHSD